jgi:hypothetical protein
MSIEIEDFDVTSLKGGLLKDLDKLEIGKAIKISYENEPGYIAKPNTFILNLQRKVYQKAKELKRDFKTIHSKPEKVLRIARIAATDKKPTKK